MDVDISKIKALADLAKELNLAELEVADGDKSVTIKTAAGVAPASVVYQQAPAGMPMVSNGVAVVAPAPQSAVIEDAVVVSSSTASAPSAVPSNHHVITSPMVGTFYRKPAPDAPPFSEVGAKVSKGQTLCIIEAMKLMNELESEVTGTVVKFLVEDSEPVEFGQELMVIEV